MITIPAYQAVPFMTPQGVKGENKQKQIEIAILKLWGETHRNIKISEP